MSKWTVVRFWRDVEAHTPAQAAEFTKQWAAAQPDDVRVYPAGDVTEPPPGWLPMGTHTEIPVGLRFSEQTDESGLPLWETCAPGSDSLAAAAVSDLRDEIRKCRDYFEAKNYDPEVLAAFEALLTAGAKT